MPQETTETQQHDGTTDAGTQQATTQTQQPPAQQERKWTDADLDRATELRLKRDRDVRDREAAKEREAAEARRLQEQGEYQKLAATAQARVADLEPQLEAVQAQLAERDKLLTSLLKAEIKGWPEKHRAAALDGVDDGDSLQLAASIKRIRPLVEDALAAQATGAEQVVLRPVRPLGTPHSPRSAGPVPDAAVEHARTVQEHHTRTVF